MAGSRKSKGEGAAQPLDAEKHGRREDYGAPIDAYLSKLPDDQRALAELLRALIREVVPTVKEEIKWGVPVFGSPRLFAHLTAYPGYIRFGFYPKIAYDDPAKRLQGSLPHVKLRTAADIDRERFVAWIRAAAAAA